MADAPRDPKRLPEWLRLDYFERPRRLPRWKWRSAWLGALAGVVPAAAVLAAALGGFKSSALTMALTGPASRAHAAFINDCARCHTGAFAPAARFSPGHSDYRSVKDEACLACHDAGVHNENQVRHVGADGHAARCADCHREHRGDSINSFADATCTACHADLNAHSVSNPRYRTPITSFANHPDFGEWRHGLKDPGKLNFSHAKHLGETLAKFREGLQARLGKARGDDQNAADWQSVLTKVGQLSEKSCHFCHQVDADGRYYQPIRYEQHCADCHWLKVPLAPPAGGWPEAVAGIALKVDEKPLQHPRPGQGPAQVRAELLDRAARFLLAARFDQPAKADEPDLRPHLLSRSLTPGQQQEALRQRRAGEAKAFDPTQAPSALHREGVLWSPRAGCAYCHQARTEPRGDTLPEYHPTALAARWEKSQRAGEDRPAAVAEQERRLWFPLGRFDHRSHARITSCAGCHKSVEQSASSRDVLMPGVDDCRQCHAPAAELSARSDCLTCHRYHDRGRERPAARP